MKGDDGEMKAICKAILITVLLLAIGTCGLKLWMISRQYADEAQIKDEISHYQPDLPKSENLSPISDDSPASPIDIPDIPVEDESNQSEAFEKIVNQNIVDMQNDVNTDIVGWLTIPNTKIDYPFVIANDNDHYLHKNIYGEQATAGSIFMDCRCAKDFTDFNTVLYGHNMKNRSMFGDLRLFADSSFFESNDAGTLFVKDNTYTLKIFAYMIVRLDDKLIFNPSVDREMFFEYVQENARRYREPTASGNVVTLSTCAYEYDGARMVLLGVIIP